MDMHELLQRPFPANKISWRVGATSRDKTSCIALAYIDARDVMHRLDGVVGFDKWQCRYPTSDAGLLICEIGLYINDQWIWKANGAGDTQVEAEKGKCSDAFKRAAVLWGVGQYLYSLPNAWVAYDQKKRKITQTPNLPKWATPEGYDELMAKRHAAKEQK